MKPNDAYSPYFSPLRIWSDIVFKAAEMMLSSAFVVGHRTSRMIQAGPLPDARDRHELTLMGSEKIFAGTEAVRAMTLGAFELNRRLGLLVLKQMMAGGWTAMALATSRTPTQYVGRHARLVRDAVSNGAAAASEVSRSTARIVTRGMQPVHARVRKNAKRLGGR